jgi:ABC-type polar amino acid transport system ATPase subunit
MILHVKHLRKTFGETAVLQDVSLTVASGEILGLVGASGSGKTVISRCLVGLESIDGGEVCVDGASLGPNSHLFDPAAQRIRGLVGLVSQTHRMPAYRRIDSIIAEGPRVVRHLSGEPLRARVHKWAKQLGLVDQLQKYPLELSAGQMARVMLARVAALEPRFMVCDEMTANLDPATAGEVAGLLESLASDGVGLLVVSHQFEFLRRSARRVGVLAAGCIVEEGSPEQVFDQPKSDEGKRFLAAAFRGR